MRSKLEEAMVRLGEGGRAFGPGHYAHEDWYGFAEFCLFLGQEGEYRRAARALAEAFGATTDPRQAEQVGRACLLAAGPADEVERASQLIDRTLADEKKHPSPVYLPYYLFAKGLAEYRLGRAEAATTVMQGPAGRVLGPAPRLVLAMARHRQGSEDEARRVLAEAVRSYDWNLARADNREAWVYHILRREAERLILPPPTSGL